MSGTIGTTTFITPWKHITVTSTSSKFCWLSIRNFAEASLSDHIMLMQMCTACSASLLNNKPHGRISENEWQWYEIFQIKISHSHHIGLVVTVVYETCFTRHFFNDLRNIYQTWRPRCLWRTRNISLHGNNGTNVSIKNKFPLNL